MADQAKESLQVRSGGDQAEGESTPSTDSAQPQEAASQAAEQAGGVAQQAVGAAQAGGDAVQEGVEEVTSAVTGEKKGSGISIFPLSRLLRRWRDGIGLEGGKRKERREKGEGRRGLM